MDNRRIKGEQKEANRRTGGGQEWDKRRTIGNQKGDMKRSRCKKRKTRVGPGEDNRTKIKIFQIRL